MHEIGLSEKELAAFEYNSIKSGKHISFSNLRSAFRGRIYLQLSKPFEPKVVLLYIFKYF